VKPGDLTGKVAIVTGSATGIGAAAAVALAQRGARILVNYRSSETEVQATAQRIRDCGNEVIVVAGEIANDAVCQGLASSALNKWGRIDIVVNNAGTTKFAAHDDLDALSAEDFADIFATNVTAPFQMIRACRPALAKAGGGTVVNVSSIAGITGLGSSVAYAASKGALNTMTLSLARALAPEIRVNAVCPGYVATPWFSRRFGEEASTRLASSVAQNNPLRRVASADDVANAIVFLATPESGQITGETLLVDSGMHLGSAEVRRVTPQGTDPDTVRQPDAV
jgi:3-oxoacyl-[acyl-carrier protein] reductase